jgi:hypothetical protein
MTEAPPEVTRHDVEQLWSDVIAGRISWQDTSAHAEVLVDRVNSENPIVNEGLLTLYYLWQPGAVRDAASLSAQREAWRDKLAEYDTDPAAWMRSYFQRMLVSHAEVRGEPAARAFGTKLVAQGLLAAADVDEAFGR